MKKCIFLIGLPGSGKSTFAKDLLSKEPEQWVYISSDVYMENKMAQENLTYAEAYKKYLDDASKNMKLTLAKALKEGSNIIWDQTNVVSSARKKKVNHLKMQKYEITAIWLNLTEDEQKKRFLNRNKEGEKVLSIKTWEKMKDEFSPPTYAEGFDIIKTINNEGLINIIPNSNPKVKN